MVRLACLAALAALTLAAAPASAQDIGGVPLSPEFLATPGAQELARNRAFGLLQLNQLAQQPRLVATGTTPQTAQSAAVSAGSTAVTGIVRQSVSR